MTLKLAIVGGGPSAFYVASRILSTESAARVHVYDRLWAPHGLVRYGVAPDHPEVKVRRRYLQNASCNDPILFRTALTNLTVLQQTLASAFLETSTSETPSLPSHTLSTFLSPLSSAIIRMSYLPPAARYPFCIQHYLPLNVVFPQYPSCIGIPSTRIGHHHPH
jgi:hypothetical protein